MKVLAIDYGTKKIGLAISNEGNKSAKPFGNLTTSHKNLYELKKIVEENNIYKIIVGVPIAEHQYGFKMTHIAIEFLNKLKVNFEIEIIEWDESFTTFYAVEKMKEAGIKEGKRNKRGTTDRWAAAIILQEYLDCH